MDDKVWFSLVTCQSCWSNEINPISARQFFLLNISTSPTHTRYLASCAFIVCTSCIVYFTQKAETNTFNQMRYFFVCQYFCNASTLSLFLWNELIFVSVLKLWLFSAPSLKWVWFSKPLPKNTSSAVFPVLERVPISPFSSCSLSSNGLGRSWPEGSYTPSLYAAGTRRSREVSANTIPVTYSASCIIVI